MGKHLSLILLIIIVSTGWLYLSQDKPNGELEPKKVVENFVEAFLKPDAELLLDGAQEDVLEAVISESGQDDLEEFMEEADIQYKIESGLEDFADALEIDIDDVKKYDEYKIYDPESIDSEVYEEIELRYADLGLEVTDVCCMDVDLMCVRDNFEYMESDRIYAIEIDSRWYLDIDDTLERL